MADDLKELINKEKASSGFDLEKEAAKLQKELLKTKKTKKPKVQPDAVFSGRFSNPDDIAMFERFKYKVQKEGKSLYQEINNIVKAKLSSDEKNEVMRDFKTDLFQALRKVSWAALSPYQLQMTKRFRALEVELAIINLKLNMIINALFKDNEYLSNQLNSPSSEFLEEIPFFNKTIRGIIEKQTTQVLNKLVKKIQTGRKSLDEFWASLSENEYDEILKEINATNSTLEEQLDKK